MSVSIAEAIYNKNNERRDGDLLGRLITQPTGWVLACVQDVFLESVPVIERVVCESDQKP